MRGVVSPSTQHLAPHGREGDLRYGDVAKIAGEGAQRGLRFAGAHTIEPRSHYWVLRLRAPDGTFYRIESRAWWQALLDALKAAKPSPPSAE